MLKQKQHLQNSEKKKEKKTFLPEVYRALASNIECVNLNRPMVYKHNYQEPYLVLMVTTKNI
jgi:hypothetical protein